MVEVQTLYSLQQFQELVEHEIGSPIARTSFWEWRQALGMESPFLDAHVHAMAIFGRYVKAGCNLRRARQLTIKFLESES